MSIQRLIVASAWSLVSVGVLLNAPAKADVSSGNMAASGQCEPRLLRAPTHFPAESQLRGEGGLVKLEVELDKGGRVTHAQVAQSSGSRGLDQAAAKSVTLDWRFDVSHCVASALPLKHDVNVVYQRVAKSFSVSVDRRGIQYARQAEQDSQCTVAPSISGSHVISCVKPQTREGLAALVKNETASAP